MDPCPPRAPPSPERCLGSPSSPGPLVPQPSPRLGRHLLNDGNGVPCMYTIRLDEEQPLRMLEAPQGEAAGGMGAPAQGYRCPKCFQVFKSPLYLKRHGISHSDLRPYVCGVCAKTFKWSSSMCQHCLTHRTRGSRAHYCYPECFQVFKSPLYLKRHGISHSDLRPYVCGVCAKTFKRSSSMCQHRLTHRTRGSRAYACPLCPRRFLEARELAQHIRGH